MNKTTVLEILERMKNEASVDSDAKALEVAIDSVLMRSNSEIEEIDA